MRIQSMRVRLFALQPIGIYLHVSAYGNSTNESVAFRLAANRDLPTYMRWKHPVLRIHMRIQPMRVRFFA